MEDTYDERSYWKDVEGLASEALELEADGSDVQEAISELVDASSWIIYYHAAAKVLLHCENEDAYLDAGLELDQSKGWLGMAAVAAFCAMEQDVTSRLERLRDERAESLALAEEPGS